MRKGIFILLIFMIQSAYARTEITACGHPDYPPWNWKRNNEIVGTCAEVVSIIFKHIGVHVSHEYVGSWKRCQKSVEDGIVDINICAFKNDARNKYAQYMDTPMGHNITVGFVNKDNKFKFNTWADLKGKRVGMVRGVSMGESFDQFIQKHSRVGLVSTREQNFAKLALKRVDVVATGLEVGLLQAHLYGYQDMIIPLEKPIHPKENGTLYISMSRKSQYLDKLKEAEKFLSNKHYPVMRDALHKYFSELYVIENKKEAETKN